MPSHAQTALFWSCHDGERFWVRVQVSDPEVATQLEQDASPNASQTSLPPEFLSTTYKAAVRTWVVLMRTCLCLSLRLDSEPCI